MKPYELTTAFLIIYVTAVSAIFENCDYFQQMQYGTAYYVYSPRYPNTYPSGTNCRWYAVSPPGTKIVLNCENINIPPSQNCYYDRLSVSLTGDLELSDARNYCGQGSFTVTSNDNQINIVLLASPTSPGGKVLCNIGVQNGDPEPPPTPPPQLCECGRKNQMRIVGGETTGVNEYPMMAALIDGMERRLFCGATIISHRYAVTAGHCLTGRQPFDIALLVGDHDITLGNDTDSAKLYLIQEFITHPNYDTVSQINDMALVRVGEDIVFSREVGPACLPFSNLRDSFAGERVEALGWGTTDFGGLPSDTLLKVGLNVLTIPQCKSSYGDMVNENQICTFRQNKDACQSDSGGPLLWTDPNTGKLKLVGIISYGIQCATDNPGVNTRVTAYLDWIQKVTDEEYCLQ